MLGSLAKGPGASPNPYKISRLSCHSVVERTCKEVLVKDCRFFARPAVNAPETGLFRLYVTCFAFTIRPSSRNAA
jgi:hypothetical protein